MFSVALAFYAQRIPGLPYLAACVQAQARIQKCTQRHLRAARVAVIDPAAVRWPPCVLRLSPHFRIDESLFSSFRAAWILGLSECFQQSHFQGLGVLLSKMASIAFFCDVPGRIFRYHGPAKNTDEILSQTKNVSVFPGLPAGRSVLEWQNYPGLSLLLMEPCTAKNL